MGRLIYDSERSHLPAGVLGGTPPGRWRLRRWEPEPKLAPYVTWLWGVEWDLDGGPDHHQSVLPHPSAHVSVEGNEAQVHGPVRCRFDRVSSGVGRVIAARFRPGGLRPLLGRPVATVVGARRPVSEVLPGISPGLAAEVEGEADAGQAAARLGAALEQVLPRELDPRIARADLAVTRIASDRSICSVDHLVNALGGSRRTLQRLFTEYVGLGVKAVIRRYRLQEAAALAHAGGELDWAELALALGYYDQSHLIRDFTATIGVPPGRYAAGR